MLPHAVPVDVRQFRIDVVADIHAGMLSPSAVRSN